MQFHSTSSSNKSCIFNQLHLSKTLLSGCTKNEENCHKYINISNKSAIFRTTPHTNWKTQCTDNVYQYSAGSWTQKNYLKRTLFANRKNLRLANTCSSLNMTGRFKVVLSWNTNFCAHYCEEGHSTHVNCINNDETLTEMLQVSGSTGAAGVNLYLSSQTSWNFPLTYPTSQLGLEEWAPRKIKQ